jgi:hypothetical protein
VSSAQLRIPLLRVFAPSVALGLTPYNFLACKAGLILSELTSRSDIINTTNTLQVSGCLLSRDSPSSPRLSFHVRCMDLLRSWWALLRSASCCRPWCRGSGKRSLLQPALRLRPAMASTIESCEVCGQFVCCRRLAVDACIHPVVSDCTAT